MNDQLSGQLTTAWTIPAYARQMLWLETESGCVRTEGSNGLFELDDPADRLTLRWGGEAGPALARLRWQPDALEWDGTVRIGGTITNVHAQALSTEGKRAQMLMVNGQPLKPGYTPFPPAGTNRQRAAHASSFTDTLADEVPFTVTTWIVTEENGALWSLAQMALVHRLPVHCVGQLAEDDWHQYVALPLVLKSITLFAPA